MSTCGTFFIFSYSFLPSRPGAPDAPAKIQIDNWLRRHLRLIIAGETTQLHFFRNRAWFCSTCQRPTSAGIWQTPKRNGGRKEASDHESRTAPNHIDPALRKEPPYKRAGS